MIFGSIFLIIFIISDQALNKFKPSVYKYSKILGWETKLNYKRSFFEKDLYGERYKIDYENDATASVWDPSRLLNYNAKRSRELS